MTECNGLPLAFSRLRRRKVHGDFNGGALTSDAGATLLRDVDRHIRPIDAITPCIRAPRDPQAPDEGAYCQGDAFRPERLVGEDP